MKTGGKRGVPPPEKRHPINARWPDVSTRNERGDRFNKLDFQRLGKRLKEAAKNAHDSVAGGECTARHVTITILPRLVPNKREALRLALVCF